MEENLDVIQVVICDDQPLIFDGIRVLFENAAIHANLFYVDDVSDLGGLLSERKPALLILDINIAGENALVHFSSLKSHSPQTKILFFSSYSAADYRQIAEQLGADGYLSKCSDQNIFISVIKEILNDRHYFLAMPDRTVNCANPVPGKVMMLDGITKREMQIIALIKEGYSEREISQKLCISNHTAKTHKKNIFKKLKVSGSNGLFKLLHQMKMEI